MRVKIYVSDVGGIGMGRLDFQFEGHPCTLLTPDVDVKGKPWVWRAEFLGGYDQIDRELLKNGWHIGYCMLSDRYGCPSAVADMKSFHDYVVENFGLAPKADIFGFSRGGLYAANYALTYPEDVSLLYLDAPVLDICSWPAGAFRGNGNPVAWEECKNCYGLTDGEATVYNGSPRYRVEELAAHRIPLLLIAGDSDEAVPFDENGAYLAAAYHRIGAPMLCILKKGCGHHPHSVTDIEQPVDFIQRYHSC